MSPALLRETHLLSQFSCEGAYWANIGQKQNQELFSYAEFPGDVSEIPFQRGSRIVLPNLFGLLTLVSEASFVPARVV
jgi:hypothetical protein